MLVKQQNVGVPGKVAKVLQGAFTKMHRAMYLMTNGAFGSGFGKRSFLLLTTIGRKSGQERMTPMFYQEFKEFEGRFILVASNWGSSAHPVWWLNLLANPQAKVQIKNKIIPITARQADPEERALLWPLIVSEYANFAQYQQNITREIPVVILTPA